MQFIIKRAPKNPLRYAATPVLSIEENVDLLRAAVNATQSANPSQGQIRSALVGLVLQGWKSSAYGQWLISQCLTDAVRFRVTGTRVFVIISFEEDQAADAFGDDLVAAV